MPLKLTERWYSSLKSAVARQNPHSKTISKNNEQRFKTGEGFNSEHCRPTGWAKNEAETFDCPELQNAGINLYDFWFTTTTLCSEDIY